MTAAPQHPRASARPLRMRLLLLAASGLMPLLVVMGWGLYYLVGERRHEAERSVLDLSRALATAVDAELKSTQVLLQHMTTADELERADLHAFYFVTRRAAQELGWRNFVLNDGEGRVLFRTNSPFGEPAPAPREPESLARAIAQRTPAVSRIVATPDFQNDTFAVRVPVVRSDKVVYVLTAVISTDRIAGVLTRQAIPDGTISSVFDQANFRVARSRQSPSPLPTDSLRELLESHDRQGMGRTLTREGVENYTGYTRLQDSGWSVVVGTSVEAANDALYAVLGAVALGLASSLALSLVLAWILSRHVIGPIEQLKEAAAALGRGQPVHPPPLDIEELDEVAVALRDAAVDRDRGTAERERAAAEREQLVARIADALKAAEEANRSKDQFLAMLGHELRNPLAPISTAVQIMAMKGDDATAHERRIIERQLVHVTRLVDDLLDVSRITSKRLVIRKDAVHLAGVLTQVVETIQSSLFQRFLSLEIAHEAQDAWVAGDEVRLVQVFNNLLVNAIKFTPAGGEIHVNAMLETGAIRVDVEDSGDGVAPEDLGRIFELFYQAPQSFDRARGGLGLGLPIVRSLVEMQGGTAVAASKGSGQGSVFTVRLPLIEAPEGSRPAPLAAAATGSGKVLVVDDNEDAADTCATLLEISGYTVRVAYTPDAALAALREFTPDVAVLDIGLPGMNGYQLAGAMKREPVSYRGRLVALTGYGQASDMAMSRQAGFDAHLTKPVSPDALLEMVEKMCADG